MNFSDGANHDMVIYMAVIKPKSTKLHLGCGTKIFNGWLNVDKFSKKADIKVDLDKIPWPLPNNHFTEIYLSHVLEHLYDVQATMDEIWRISKKGAKVTIIVPHFSGMAAPSPFHKHTFNSQSMNYFTEESNETYGKAKFKIKSTKIYWYPSTDKEYISKSILRKVAYYLGEFLNVLINANRHFFERI